MSEDARSKNQRRVLYVANPGSDSDDSDDNNLNYHNLPSSISTQQQPTSRPSAYHPAPLTTNLPPDHTHHYQHSNPTLSSPSSTSSPAAESTPPPSTPGIAAPSTEQDLPITPYIERADSQQQISTSRKIFQSLKSPFHHHRVSHLPRPTSSQKRPATVRFPCPHPSPCSLSFSLPPFPPQTRITHNQAKALPIPYPKRS